MGIDILLNDKYLSFGIRQWLSWQPEKSPHVLVVGNTGSGKTYFTQILLGKTALCESNLQFYVCDFKGDLEFTYLNDCSRFYRFMDCSTGLQQFYMRFQARQNGNDKTRNMLILFFDEWASYCNSLDKKLWREKSKSFLTF